MIFPKQSIQDEFFLSHLENQTYLEWNESWRVQNIHTYVIEEETMSKYHATGIPPKQLQLIQYIPCQSLKH